MKHTPMLLSRLNYTVFITLALMSIPVLAGCSARLTASRLMTTPDPSEPIQAVSSPTTIIIFPTLTPTEQASITPAQTAIITSTVTIAASAIVDMSTPTLVPTVTGQVAWSDAGLYEGEERVVCGPVAGTHFAEDSRGQPTFLNLGEDYPSPKRFVVLIWGDDRSNFSSAPEDYFEGKTICASGEIQEYEGVFEIEVRSPEQIEIQQSSS